VVLRRIRQWAFAPLLFLAWFFAAAAPSLAAIHPGDTLFVKVWNHPELSKQVVVDATGGIRVPLSGIVAVGGLDERAAASKLADALRPYVVYPAVNVETLTQGDTIFVAGGPVGQLIYKPGETLTAAVTDAMASTGPVNTQTLNDAGVSLTRVDGQSASIRSRIDLHTVSVQRDNTSLGTFDTVALSAGGQPGPLLLPGDTIVFAYKPVVVRVLGDVAQPGLAYLLRDQSMSEAIAQAGGLLPTSAINHILLARDGTVRSLALGDPTFSEPAQPGDVITVPQAPRVNVVGTVVTPGIVTLRTDASLLSAMYTAGGPTKYSNLKDVSIVRGSQKMSYNVTALTHGDMSQNPTLQDGDTVVVPEGHYFDFTGLFGILGGVAAGLATRI
jgi:protein involved in polysaccharide export with SLBB domain